MIKKLETKEIFEPLVFLGTLEAQKERALHPKVQGFIDSISVDEGDIIKKGETILKIAPRSSGFNYKLHTLKAPFTGQITAIPQKEGELVGPNTLAAKIAVPKEFKTTIHITTKDWFTLKKNTPISIIVAPGTSHEISTPGKIVTRTPVFNPISETAEIDISFFCTVDKSECSKRFLFGSNVKVMVKQNVRKGITIPIKYLVEQRSKVMLLSNEITVKFAKVKLGKSFGDSIEILSGLQASDQIVTNFSQYPKKGEKVKIINADIATKKEPKVKPKG